MKGSNFIGLVRAQGGRYLVLIRRAQMKWRLKVIMGCNLQLDAKQSDEILTRDGYAKLLIITSIPQFTSYPLIPVN